MNILDLDFKTDKKKAETYSLKQSNIEGIKKLASIKGITKSHLIDVYITHLLEKEGI